MACDRGDRPSVHAAREIASDGNISYEVAFDGSNDEPARLRGGVGKIHAFVRCGKVVVPPSIVGDALGLRGDDDVVGRWYQVDVAEQRMEPKQILKCEVLHERWWVDSHAHLRVTEDRLDLGADE